MMRIHGIHGDGHLTIGCGSLPIGFWRNGAAVHRDMARLGAAMYELDEVPPRTGRGRVGRAYAFPALKDSAVVAARFNLFSHDGLMGFPALKGIVGVAPL